MDKTSMHISCNKILKLEVGRIANKLGKDNSYVATWAMSIGLSHLAHELKDGYLKQVSDVMAQAYEIEALEEYGKKLSLGEGTVEFCFNGLRNQMKRYKSFESKVSLALMHFQMILKQGNGEDLHDYLDELKSDIQGGYQVFNRIKEASKKEPYLSLCLQAARSGDFRYKDVWLDPYKHRDLKVNDLARKKFEKSKDNKCPDCGDSYDKYEGSKCLDCQKKTQKRIKNK